MTEIDAQAPPAAGHFIEQASKLLGAATAAFLILSVCYDYCFLMALDLSFRDIPTTISDHARSSIVWAPAIAATFALVSFFVPVLLKLDRFTTRRPEERSPSASEMVLWTFIASALVSVAMFGTLNEFFFTAASFLALFLLRVSLRSELLRKRLGVYTRCLLFALPVIATLIPLKGYQDGLTLLESRTEIWAVALKTEQGRREQSYVGMRRFTAVSILVSKGGILQVVPSDAVLQATLHVQPDASLACRWLKFYCRTPPSTAGKLSVTP